MGRAVARPKAGARRAWRTGRRPGRAVGHRSKSGRPRKARGPAEAMHCRPDTTREDAASVSQTIRTLLRTLRGAGDPAGEPADAELVRRFAARRDGAAFAALVGRHGPMVLGVCRRLLADPHDAEDAFQATFLVLARRAASLPARRVLAGWLHGVARRTSL